MTSLRRIQYLLGWIMLVIAAGGVVLPVLPTTPFALMAVWLFGRSSPKLETWLLNHAVLGPPINNWRRQGAITSRTKLAAIASIAVGYAATLYLAQTGPLIAGLLGLVLVVVSLFIVSRPAPS